MPPLVKDQKSTTNKGNNKKTRALIPKFRL